MLKNKLKLVRHFATQPSSAFYVTTPIFYVNASPHIGHLYSAVIADAICRYQQLKQPETAVLFCTGTDEHGTKIQQAAASHNVPVAKYCDDISSNYRSIFQQALIANTDFIRTSEQRHKLAVQQFWTHLKSRGHINSAQYSGWYCVADETFLTDSQLKLDAATSARYSLESGHPVEWTEERNYMFSLEKFQNDLLYWAKGGEGKSRIRPVKFEKILLDYLSEPLPDVSISRPANRVHWAIPVPEDETQTVYVWLDALVNYLTSVGYPDEKYKAYWPPKVQVIGKDILKFHGIYWPAFLIAAGLEPPQELFVHSHWTVDGQKMSKSKHNVVDPQEAAKIYTMEGLRYFLLREGVAHSDGNYSNTKALRILNSELADTLGNLLSRVCAKSLNPRQVYPRLHRKYVEQILQLDVAKRLHEALQQLDARCAQHYEDKNFYLVVDSVMSTLHAANNFFETTRPWELKAAKSAVNSSSSSTQHVENAMKLETLIAMTMDTLRLCGIVLQPLIPALSTRLLDKLNVPQSARLWRNLSESFVGGSEWEHDMEQPLDSSTDAVLFRRILLKEDDVEDRFKQQKQQQQQDTQDALTTKLTMKKKIKQSKAAQ